MNNKLKGPGVITLVFLIVVVVVIFGTGYLVFNSFVSGMTNSQAMSNVTSTVNTGDTIFSVGSVVLIVFLVTAIVSVAYYSVSSRKRYSRMSNVLSLLITTTYYFGWGLLAFAVVVLPSYLLYLSIQYTVESGSTGALFDVLKIIGIAILAYFALAGLGYVVKKKFVDKLRERRKEKQEEDIAEGLDKVMG